MRGPHLGSITFAMLQIGIDWGSALVPVGVIVGLTSTMLVTFYAMIDSFWMALDGARRAEAHISPSYNIDTQGPVSATIPCGVAMASIAGLVPLGALTELGSVSILAQFAVV